MLFLVRRIQYRPHFERRHLFTVVVIIVIVLKRITIITTTCISLSPLIELLVSMMNSMSLGIGFSTSGAMKWTKYPLTTYKYIQLYI